MRKCTMQKAVSFETAFCNGDEPKPGIYQNFGSRLQSLNMPFGTFGDSMPLR